MKNSNDYKSMLGFWKKLNYEEKKKFIVENVNERFVDNSKMNSSIDDELEKLKKEIDKAINHREMPPIDFSNYESTNKIHR